MSQAKKTFFINMGTGEISQSRSHSDWNFQIQATNEEIMQLREYFNRNENAEWKTFYRAHLPFVEYHHDSSNDEYDATLEKIYDLLYKLGNEEAKEHIKSMGILNDNETM